MLGQPHLEKLLDRKLKEAGSPVQRDVEVLEVGVSERSDEWPAWARVRDAFGEEVCRMARLHE